MAKVMLVTDLKFVAYFKICHQKRDNHEIFSFVGHKKIKSTKNIIQAWK